MPHPQGVRRLELFEATPFSIGAFVHGHLTVVRAKSPSGVIAPEMDAARLIFRVLLEVLSEDEHGFAAQ